MQLSKQPRLLLHHIRTTDQLNATLQLCGNSGIPTKYWVHGYEDTLKNLKFLANTFFFYSDILIFQDKIIKITRNKNMQYFPPSNKSTEHNKLAKLSKINHKIFNFTEAHLYIWKIIYGVHLLRTVDNSSPRNQRDLEKLCKAKNCQVKMLNTDRTQLKKTESLTWIKR